MAWQCSAKSNQGLIDNLRSSNIIKSDAVYMVMSKLDRSNFGRPAFHNSIYKDSPCSIGFGVTISAPHMHAMMLEVIADKLVSRIDDGLTCCISALDVGSGSGYITAAMALLVGESGRVYGVDHVEELVEWSKENIKRDSPNLTNYEIFTADGRNGFPEHAPFDVIHVGAAADNLIDDLKQQLKIGGRMIIPVGSRLLQVDRTSEIEWKQLLISGVCFVPLTDLSKQIGD